MCVGLGVGWGGWGFGGRGVYLRKRRGRGVMGGDGPVPGGAHFCPVMDCDMDRGGIMSSRYSRCRSARLEPLWPPTAPGFR